MTSKIFESGRIAPLVKSQIAVNHSYNWLGMVSLLLGSLCGLGCNNATEEVDVVPMVSEVDLSETFEYSKVELTEPNFRVDEEGVCWFEVKYKFLKGGPKASYLLTLRFPGTKNACIKDMAGWQLPGSEGVIKDGITLQEPNISKFEIVLSEAEVPMNGFTEISNVLTGQID